MSVERPGTHQTHCCKFHGCKYDHPECPVKSGELMQEYPCEWCYGAKEEYEEAWEIVSRGKTWFGD